MAREEMKSRPVPALPVPYLKIGMTVLFVLATLVVLRLCFAAFGVNTFFAASNKAGEDPVPQNAQFVNYCAPAPETFLSEARELRFRKERGVKCFEVALGERWTSFVYPPLGFVTPELPIEPIAPGIIEVRMKDGTEYKMTVAERDLLDRRKLPRIRFGERCMVFQLRGTAKVRIIVDRFEQLDPNGVEQSTYCPGMY